MLSHYISSLYKISQAIINNISIEEIISLVLQVMNNELGMSKGMLTLFDRDKGSIFIKRSFGFSESELARWDYKVGEGITGTVVENGSPIIVPDIAKEPMFLDKTGVHKKTKTEKMSFLCIPLKISHEVIGTLSAVIKEQDQQNPDKNVELISIIAAMISQIVALQKSINDENWVLKAENQRLQESLIEKFSTSNIKGNSSVMRDLFMLINKVAETNATILILGESGVGKELVASAIHYNSLRKNNTFIKCNMAALPEHLIESELFGHEKGAFTSAHKKKIGRFEMADKGTIFLDEIGELSPGLQTKLLRVLQEKEFERVGGTDSIKTDIRIIAATNRNLEKLIQEQKFREDLYYRLNVFSLNVPPLRERKTDILLLANHFIEKYNRINKKGISRISTPAIDLLMSYHWPGNVRELENCIERAVILSDDNVIHAFHLPPTLQTAGSSNTLITGTLHSAVNKLEYEMIIEALKAMSGNISKASHFLGVSERILGLRIKKFNIDYKKFR